MIPFLIAFQFLTILPIKISGRIKKEYYGKSLLFFPAVGLVIGVILVLVSMCVSFTPVLFQSALIVAASVLLTGGLHLDGFADTCDGFYGMQPKEKILTIMRDSCCGAMGVIGLICLLMLKFSVFACIQRDLLWKVLILSGTFSRWSQAFVCFNSRYPHKDGKGKYFIKYANLQDIHLGSMFVFALFIILGRLEGVIVFIFSFCCVVGFRNYVRKRIGGMTGDTIGATSEIAELGVLIFFMLYQFY